MRKKHSQPNNLTNLLVAYYYLCYDILIRLDQVYSILFPPYYFTTHLLRYMCYFKGWRDSGDCLFVHRPNLKHDKLTNRRIFDTPVFNNMAQLQFCENQNLDFHLIVKNHEKSHCASISILYLQYSPRVAYRLGVNNRFKFKFKNSNQFQSFNFIA